MKWLIRLFLGLLLLIIVAVGILSLGSVQRYLVLQGLQTDQNEVKLESIQVGPSRIALSGFSLSERDLDVRLDTVDIQWSLMASLSSRALVCEQFKVAGLVVELKELPKEESQEHKHHGRIKYTRAKGEAASERFEGLLNELQGLQKLRISKLDVVGKFILPEQRLGQFSLKGSKLLPGENGQLTYSLEFKDDSSGAVVNVLEGKGDLILTQKAGPLEAISMTTSLEATGPEFPEGAHLSFQATGKKAAEGELYGMSLASLSEEGAVIPLASLETLFDPKARTVQGEFDASLNNEQVGVLAVAFAMPVFQLEAKGNYSFDVNQDKGKGYFSFDLDARELERVSPDLKALGSFFVKSKLEMNQANDALVINAMNASLTLGNQQNQGEVLCKLLEPFRFNLSPLMFETEGRVLELAINELDLSALLKGAGVQFSSKPLSTRCFLSIGSESEVSVACARPFLLNNINFAVEGTPILAGVDLDLVADFTYQNGMGLLELHPAVLEKAGEKVLSLMLQAQIVGGKDERVIIDSKFSTDLQRLCQQPFAKTYLLGDFNKDFVFNGTLEGIYDLESVFKVENFTLVGKLLEGAEANAVEVDLLQPLKISFEALGDGLPHLIKSNEPFLKCSFNSFPLEVLNPFVPNYTFGGVLKQGALNISERQQGLFSAKGTTRGFSIEAYDPLELANVSLREGTVPMLNNVYAQIDPDTFYAENRLELKWDELKLSNHPDYQMPFVEGGIEAILDLQQAFPLTYYAVDLEVGLDRLLAQPAFMDPYRKVTRGHLSVAGKGDFSGMSSGQTHFEMAFKDVGSSESIYLDEMTANLEGTLLPSGKGSFSLPLVMKGQRGESDLNIKGSISGKKEARNVTVTVSGRNVIVDDALLLAEAFQTTEGPSSVPETASSYGATPESNRRPTYRDAHPFWAGFTGKATLDIDQIRYRQYAVKQLDGDFEARPNRLILEKLNCKLADSQFGMKGNVTFSTEDSLPYRLFGEMLLNEFDVGEFLSRIKPQESPPAEGIFTLKGKVHGHAPNLDILIEQVQGEFSLKGKNGLVRALDQMDEQTKAVTGVVGIIGAVTGSRVRELETVTEALSYFQEIPFKHLSVHAQRGNEQNQAVQRNEDLNVNLTELIIQSPDIFIQGDGVLYYDPLMPIHDQQLSVQARLDAQGRAASILNKLGLVEPQETSRGYYKGPEFIIKGTPSDPDFSSLHQIIQQAGTSLIGGGKREPLPNNEQEQEEEDDLSKAVESIFGIFGK